MEMAGSLITKLYGAIFAVGAVLIVYLIFKRIKEKKEENFEDRDN